MIVMQWWTCLGLVSMAVFWIGMAAYCGYHLGRADAFREAADHTISAIGRERP